MKLLKFKARDLSIDSYKELEEHEKNLIRYLPLEEDRHYEGEETGNYYIVEFRTGKKKIPKEWFKETEPVELKGGLTVNFVGGDWADKKVRAERDLANNPYKTTLSKYDKRIKENSQKAKEFNEKQREKHNG